MLKHYLHDALVVRKQRLVTVAKIKSPDFDVLVSGARYDEL